MDVKQMRQERGQIETRMANIIKAADDEDRGFTAEEQEEMDKGHQRSLDLKARIDAHERLAEVRSANQEFRDDFPPSNVRGGDREDQVTDEVRALAVQAWCLQRAELPMKQCHREALEKVALRSEKGELILPIARTHDLLALQDQYRTTHPALVKRSLDLTSGASLVPQGFVNRLESTLLAVGSLLQVVEIMRTETGNDLPWPTEDDTANEAEIIAEKTDFGASVDPTLSSITLKAYKFYSKPVRLSSELLQDSAFNLVDYLGNAFGGRMGRGMNTKFTTGTGTNEPQGIVTGATVGKTAASATAITTDEILDLIHSVDPAYRANARFMLHDNIVLAIRKLKDTTNQYLWQPGLQMGVPDRLAGYPVTINQAMASTVATGNKTILYGDTMKYKVRQAGDLRMKRSEHLYLATDEEVFVAYLRADGRLINSAAVKVLQQL